MFYERKEENNIADGEKRWNNICNWSNYWATLRMNERVLSLEDRFLCKNYALLENHNKRFLTLVKAYFIIRMIK